METRRRLDNNIFIFRFTRKRINNLKCSCNKGRNQPIIESGRGYSMPSMPECGRIHGVSSLHEKEINQYNYPTVRQSSQLPGVRGGLRPGQTLLQGRSNPILRTPGVTSSVIVNPLPPTSLQDLVVNSYQPRHPSYPIYNPKDELEEIGSNPEPVEPIYQEIKPRTDKVEEEEKKETEEEVRNKLGEVSS